jgi:uncharacterized protein YndB with AHSA1/START domain
VWELLSDRREEWWCPTPWYARFDKHDPRPGGACNMTFYGPDGEKEPQNGIYLAYEEGKRFVMTDAVTDDFEPAGPFMVGIWQIDPEGDGTRYTAVARHWTAEAAKQHEDMGFTQGWEATAAILAEICERESR